MSPLKTEMKYVSVILDDAIEKPLDYRIPDEMMGQIEPGMRVAVPLRKSIRKGTTLALKKTPEFEKCVEINAILSEKPLIPKELYSLAIWMSAYYATPLNKILKCIMPPSVRAGMEEKKQLFVKLAKSKNQLAEITSELQRKSPAQAKFLEPLLQAPKGLFLTEVLEQSGVSRSVVHTLEKKGFVNLLEVSVDRILADSTTYFKTAPKKLSEEQQEALNQVDETLEKSIFSTFLLHGVTGSGKTEVYMRAMESAIAQKKGVILLVPEIALTSQTIERLRARFQEKIAILHHRLSHGERRDSWHEISTGKIQIVVGARSAIFSPVHNLGLIIVDEEHENSYKQQDDTPTYHARDLAVMRAKLTRSTTVLGSATPSLESYYNAQIGKYTLLTLLSRPTQHAVPKAHIVDMKREYEQQGRFTLFSSKLIDGIQARLEKGEQTLLFLNRRGYHTTQICENCGEARHCPHCSVSLTFHREKNTLRCHLCHYDITPPPQTCESCGSEKSMQFKGAGTEQVERAVHALFPEIRTLRLDADTTKHKGSHEKIYRAFRSGKADLLIGTQMVAKGLHFPMCTLVGVLSADSTLNMPDFRASEQVFQLITQVSGRAGRSELPGEVVIQTHLPEHPAITLSSTSNYTHFYETEIESRKMFNYPPFAKFVKIHFSGEDEQKTEQFATHFQTALSRSLPSQFEIYPIMPSGYAKIKDRYRFNLLIKGPATRPITSIYMKLRAQFRTGKTFRISIDVDPTSTFF